MSLEGWRLTDLPPGASLMILTCETPADQSSHTVLHDETVLRLDRPNNASAAPSPQRAEQRPHPHASGGTDFCRYESATSFDEKVHDELSR